MKHPLVHGVIALVVLAATAPATIIRPMPLEEVVGHASEIFSGTVRSMRVVEGGPPRNLLFTEVTFEGLTTLKGDAKATSRTYRFAGGVLEGRRVVVVGVPRFTKGRRYVLFANADLDSICPAIGWGQGRYRALRDVDSGKEILADSDGRVVYGFEYGMPVTRPPSETARPVTVEAFLDRVRSIVEEQAKDGEMETPEDDETPETGEEGEDR